MKSYLFPGQGSQSLGMGESLFDLYPALTEKADQVLGYSIKALCLKDEKRQLNRTQYTQPAIYVVNALSYRHKIEQTGVRPDFVAGHSLGEYNALQAAGGFSFEDGLKMVKKRGELMAQAAKGAMAAVLKLTENKVRQCLHENDLYAIDIANINSSTQIVISGLQEDINCAQDCIEEMDGDFFPLNTSGAFHSRYMEPAKKEFERFLKQFEFAALTIPVISNIQARPYQQDQIAINLVNQITHSVRWQQSMQYLLEQGVSEFEELGSGDVLTKLMTWIQADINAKTLSAIERDAAIVKKSAEKQAQVHGNDIEALKRRIAEWNNSNPIGSKVTANGFKETLQTRTQAMILLGHRGAVYMEGYKGYF